MRQQSEDFAFRIDLRTMFWRGQHSKLSEGWGTAAWAPRRVDGKSCTGKVTPTSSQLVLRFRSSGHPLRPPQASSNASSFPEITSHGPKGETVRETYSAGHDVSQRRNSAGECHHDLERSLPTRRLMTPSFTMKAERML